MLNPDTPPDNPWKPPDNPWKPPATLLPRVITAATNPDATPGATAVPRCRVLKRAKQQLGGDWLGQRRGNQKKLQYGIVNHVQPDNCSAMLGSTFDNNTMLW